MPTLMGFGTFATLREEQISEKISRRIVSGDQGMLVWWSIGAGVHVEPHSHANEQIVWMLKGKMEFRLGSEQRVKAWRRTLRWPRVCRQLCAPEDCQSRRHPCA
jgi:quercetin dioxygenase-like cupin family protein